jgi:Xaa-Pro aminopeptidase
MRDFTPEEMLARLDRVRALMAAESVDALISGDTASVRYLTGFRGEPARLLLTAAHAVLYTSFRSIAWAEDQTSGIELSVEPDPLADIGRRLGKDRLRVGVDSGIRHCHFNELQRSLPDHRAQPTPVVDLARRIKSAGEIALLRRSQRLNEQVLQAVLPQIRAGMTERGVQGLILAEIAANEALDGPSFPPIVAAGANAWEIHHRPDATPLRPGDMVILDLGVTFRGYASDMTRSICLGEPTAAMREVYELVLEAQRQAFAGIRAGASSRTVDAAARSVIRAAGLDRGSTHGLGHGIGLEVHDPGLTLSPSGPESLLEAGMVLTIEPGIYLEGEFGVRTEDIVVVLDGGFENLTTLSHDLICL